MNKLMFTEEIAPLGQIKYYESESFILGAVERQNLKHKT